MAKEELLEFDGTVTEVLPDGNFRVKLDNDHEVLAYTAGKMRKFRIRTGVGDRVIVGDRSFDVFDFGGFTVSYSPTNREGSRFVDLAELFEQRSADGGLASAHLSGQLHKPLPFSNAKQKMVQRLAVLRAVEQEAWIWGDVERRLVQPVIVEVHR